MQLADALGKWTLWDTLNVDRWLSKQREFSLVYMDGNSSVYKNNSFEGMAYSIDGAVLNIEQSFNEITITSDKPTALILCQSYDDKWIVDGGSIEPYGMVDMVKMDGTSIILKYSGYGEWINILCGCWLGAFVMCGVLVRLRK